MGLQPGQRLSHYQIVGKIGEGGMGAVYEATDTRLNRNVAIKVLPPEVTSDPERRGRFIQEAQLAAAFNHPNIATVHDVGEEGDVIFIVMEIVRGQSVRALIGDRQIDVGRVLDIAHGVAAGLARAHREGVLHRDLKPDNVMLTDEGQPKILDFGLGKLVQETQATDLSSRTPTATQDAAFAPTPPGSPHVTREGQVVGTLAYMSPEQLQGRDVDAGTDIFSFGVLLYEMLAGRRPFSGQSNLDTATSILRDDPIPLPNIRRDVPSDLHAVLSRCLQKDPGARYASGQELLDALEEIRGRRDAPAAGLGSLLSRPGFLVAAAVVLVAVIAGVVWLGIRSSRVRWARDTALPEAERLAEAGDNDGVLRLLRQVAEITPDDPRVTQLVGDVTYPAPIESEPSGAEVFVKGYEAGDRPWIHLGQTPLSDVPLPLPVRLRLEKPGYIPFEAAPLDGFFKPFVLARDGEAPESMVRVPPGSVDFGTVAGVELDAFWIDKYEVTNSQFKEFVDAGGYRSPEYWPESIGEEILKELVDSTGRPGPAGWELGSYPEGTEDHPVGGVSWYETAAYAAWAGKSLPTVFHWHRAAEQSIFSEIVPASNFGGEGPAPVGSFAGLGPHGTYDMAGNVREWCVNRADDRRYMLGGAWSEPNYMYRDPEATDPRDRSPRNGFRCIRTDGPLVATSTVDIDESVYDFSQSEPVSDEVFEVFRGLYAYDRTDLDARVESVDDAHEHYRKEIVSFRAAYGDERVFAHIFLPKNAPPPYQTVIYFPGSGALEVSSSRHLRLEFGRFLPRTGRAVVYPIYKGTYERQVELSGVNAVRDLIIQMSKDLQRTIDYLETRDDIDTDKLAYYGLSLGAGWGQIFTAIETRFSASILLAGGLAHYPPERPPESIPINFAPRATVPVLVINSRNDFSAPVETEIKPMFDLQGAPDEDKRLVLLDGGHVPDSPNAVIREVLDWLDKYLGPV